MATKSAVKVFNPAGKAASAAAAKPVSLRPYGEQRVRGEVNLLVCMRRRAAEWSSGHSHSAGHIKVGRHTYYGPSRSYP